MKKFLIFVFSFIALLLVSIYVFVPGKVHISKNDVAGCNISNAYRILSDTSSWQKWWPEKDGFMKRNLSGSEIFFYRGTSYRLAQKSQNPFTVEMKTDYSTIDSRIKLIPLNNDSTRFNWNFDLPTGINPVRRLLKYREAIGIQKDFAVILSNLKSFLEDKKNLEE